MPLQSVRNIKATKNLMEISRKVGYEGSLLSASLIFSRFFSHQKVN